MTEVGTPKRVKIGGTVLSAATMGGRLGAGLKPGLEVPKQVDPNQPLSIRDQKKQRIQKTQAKQEAQNTRTRRVYEECLRELERESQRIQRENTQLDAEAKS